MYTNKRFARDIVLTNKERVNIHEILVNYLTDVSHFKSNACGYFLAYRTVGCKFNSNSSNLLR